MRYQQDEREEITKKKKVDGGEGTDMTKYAPFVN